MRDKNDILFGWHFLKSDRRLGYGDGREVRQGETLSVEGRPALCQVGMHASPTILEALRYAPGPVLCRVRLSGPAIIVVGDKAVANARHVQWMADVTELLKEFSTDMDLFSRCGSAAGAAAWVTAGATAWDAAGDAAQVAVGDAALAAARAAARDAAWDAALAAAWAAAGAAARDAARAAAGAAAGDAALAAAGDAALAAARAAARLVLDDWLLVKVRAIPGFIDYDYADGENK